MVIRVFLHFGVDQKAEFVLVRLDVGDGGVERNVGKRIDAGLPALLGEVGKAVQDSLVGAAVGDDLAVDLYLSRYERPDAEQGFHEFRASGAD